jgi:hypothetical protein
LKPLASIGKEGKSTDAEGDEDVAEELLLNNLHPPA